MNNSLVGCVYKTPPPIENAPDFAIPVVEKYL